MSRIRPGPGAVAQLGERHVRNVEVGGSIPLGSTRAFRLKIQPRKITPAAAYEYLFRFWPAKLPLVRITDKWKPVIGKMIRIYKKLDRKF